MSGKAVAEVGTRDVGELAERASTTVQADDLLRLALEREGGIDVVERIVALREREQARQAERSFFEALAAFQDECPPITKSKEGLRTKNGKVVSWYAPLDKVVMIARPVLRRHGFAFKWDSRTEDKVMHTTCTLRHEDGHSDTSTFSAPVGNISSLTSGMQDHSGALTYGKRQSFVQVTGLVTADLDNDGYVPVEAITESQAADLIALAEEVGADKSAFLRWFGVDAWAEIPAERLAEATQALERKRK
jgi:hypothetical protein